MKKDGENGDVRKRVLHLFEKENKKTEKQMRQVPNLYSAYGNEEEEAQNNIYLY